MRKVESVSETDEIGNVFEGVVDLARKINLEEDSDDVQELLNSHKHELAINELIEMHEQEQGIKQREGYAKPVEERTAKMNYRVSAPSASQGALEAVLLLRREKYLGNRHFSDDALQFLK
ncbi:hypothetical protein TNCV_1212401 [Trichonephila clavipes]|nr:hypothetical protein TNCV_1212401 [Trichonephila clavipes]